jgi:hypothetical protein
MAAGPIAVGQEEANGGSQLIVFVYNDAGVPEAALQRAEQETSKIFWYAGVRIEWGGHGGSKGVEAVDSARDNTILTLAVRIVSHSRNLSDDVFGVAFLGADGIGQQADVFYDNVALLSKQSSRNSGEVLGNVMAHELGHLVLGSNSHAPIGLMKRHWASEDLKKMSMGQLRFEAGQTVQVRNRLEKTNRSTAVLRAATANFTLH